MSKPLSLPLYGPSYLMELYNKDREAWSKQLQQYLDLLPMRATMEAMVCDYVNEMDPLFCYVNGAILKIHLDMLYTQLGLSRANSLQGSEEQDAFEKTKGSLGLGHRAKAVESAFWADARHYGLLALLFGILYAATSVLDPSEVQAYQFLENTEPSDLKGRIDAFHDAGVFFFQHSNFMEQPTLWTLQNFNILSIKYWNMREMHIAVIWNRLAISLAQQMGLNCLGSALDDIMHDASPSMRSDFLGLPWIDEMSPTDLSQRELGRMLWATLLRFDWFCSFHVDFTYSISDSMNQTSPPAALHPEEVLMLRQLPPSVLNEPDRPTPTVYLRILLDVGRLVRQISEILLRRRSQRQKAQLTWEETQYMDCQIRALQNTLPKYFCFDPETIKEADTQAILAKYPYLKIQRLFLQEQFQYRLLRLHLPFMEAEIQAGDKSMSIDTCIEGARMTIAVYEELQLTHNRNRRTPFLFWHLLTSATVLQRLLMHYPMPQHRQASLMRSLHQAVRYLEEVPLPISLKAHTQLQATLDVLRRFSQGTQRELEEDANTTSMNTSQAHSAPTDLDILPSSACRGSYDETAATSEYELFEIPGWTDADDAMLLAGLEFLLEHSN